MTSVANLRRRLAVLAATVPTSPPPLEPDLDIDDLPVDPIERKALAALVMEALPMSPDAPSERLVALLDAVSRRDGLVWAAAVAAAKAPVEQFGIDVKAELQVEAEGDRQALELAPC
jgi:hypothetical protein